MRSLANFPESKVRSLDRDASTQREQNVPAMATSDVCGGGRLHDEQEKRLRRRLGGEGGGGGVRGEEKIALILKNFISSSKKTPWDALH